MHSCGQNKLNARQFGERSNVGFEETRSTSSARLIAIGSSRSTRTVRCISLKWHEQLEADDKHDVEAAA